MTSTATSLYDLASELLTQSAAILDTTTSKAPKIQYVSHAPPALDCCGLLTVHAGALTYGPFGNEQIIGDAFAQSNRPVVPIAPLYVSVFRCATAVPVGGAQITLPAAAKMAADALVTYTDVWTLWCGIRQQVERGALFAGFPCRPFMTDSVTLAAPQGGCIGWVVGVQVSLDGFSPMP